MREGLIARAVDLSVACLREKYAGNDTTDCVRQMNVIMEQLTPEEWQAAHDRIASELNIHSFRP